MTAHQPITKPVFPPETLATMTALYPLQAGLLHHHLPDHPLLSLEALAQLGEGLPASAVEYNLGNVPIGIRPEDIPSNGLSIGETIRTIDGNGSWAVLLGVDARTARLHLGGRTVDLDRVLVQSRWDGRYAGLWQGPPALSPPPRPGASGPAVDWVRQRVSRADGVTPGAPYDAALRADVATLQAARGLPADGIAGPLTLMALAGDLPGPRLLRVLE
jgi:peptidoglycan hydrolase-like protein with peptidoglycan-binding domain